jgi:hypothetical protein
LWDDYAIEPQGVLDFAKIFGNTHDVVLEIGFGNGDTLKACLLSALVLIHFSKRPQCQPTKDSPAYLRLKSDKSASIFS